MQLHLPITLEDVPNAGILSRLAAAWNPLDLSGDLRLAIYAGPHGHLLVFDGRTCDGKELTCSTVIHDEILRSDSKFREAARIFREFADYVESCSMWDDVLSRVSARDRRYCCEQAAAHR